MQPNTIEKTPPVCAEAPTDAGKLLVAEVAGVVRSPNDWHRAWSAMETAFHMWREVRPVADLVMFDRISGQMEKGEGELDAVAFGTLLGAFIESQGVPAVTTKIQALVYLGSPDVLHQTLAVNWLQAHRPATVKTLKFLLSEAVRTRTARTPDSALASA